jgi:cullin 1
LKESSAFLQSGTVSDYMQKAENRIRKEEESGVFYFLPTTKPKLKLALDEAMITKHFDQLQNAFQDMIEHEEENDMRRFYFLFSRLDDGLQNSARTFQAHLKKVGTAIMAQQKAIKDTKKAISNAIPFIKVLLCLKKKIVLICCGQKELLVLHGKYLRIINTCFTRDGDQNGDPLFQQAMDKAFTEIVNLPTGKFTMARLLSFYTDKVLSGKEKVEDHEINGRLEEVARLFSYFQDKDSFAEYVRKGLCKRLLGSDKEFNEAHEQTFISKLKERCGNNYTRHLQGMFADINDAASKAIADGFVDWNKSEKVGKVDLVVTVLNESHWPIAGAEKFALSLSKPLSDCVSKFEEYYKSKTDKRKLRWLFNHGNVVLATHYGKGKVQVEVTPLQACILQLFEKERTITFESMIKLLWPDGQALVKGGQSNADTLKFAIAPLVQTKGIAPIKRSGEGKEISENDKFQIRSEIKTKKRRLKFAGGSAAKTDSESKDVEKGVLKQREFEIDAAMVRIMKSRNVLSWNELTSESIRALKDRFQPNPRILKKRLESLIEREFMVCFLFFSCFFF